jgi:hypothetical protein
MWVDRFMAAFNSANTDELDKTLSPEFRWYSIGPPDSITVFDRSDAITYFRDRSARGERLALESIEVSPYLANGNVGFALAARRTLNGQSLLHKGKGAFYCARVEQRGILVLSFGAAGGQ